MRFIREYLLSNAKKIGPRRAKSIWETLVSIQYYYLPIIIAMTVSTAFIAVASYAVSFFLPIILIAPAVIYGIFWVIDIPRLVHNLYCRKLYSEINKFNNVVDYDFTINDKQKLYKLIFTDMVIDNDVAAKLAALLDANPDIRTLDLSGCKFSTRGDEGEGFAALSESIIRRLDSLKVIDLSNAQDYNIFYICYALETLINRLTAALRDNNKLTHLRLPNISSKAALNVLPFVDANRVLVELSIAKIFDVRESDRSSPIVSFEKSDVVQLIAAINRNKKLQIINIPDLLISEETIADLEEILARPDLIKLSLHGWRASIDNALKERFATALRRNTSITNIAINTNGSLPGGSRDTYLEEADLLLIIEALASDRITEFNICTYSNNRVLTAAAATRIAAAINRMPNLKKINLKSVLFSQEGLRIIGEALRQRRKLREIKLEEAGIVHTPTGEQFITTFAPENPTINDLTTLDLKDAPLVTDSAGITQIANVLRDRNNKLRILGIRFVVPENLRGDAYTAALNAGTMHIVNALIANKKYTSLDTIVGTNLNRDLLQRAINVVNDFRGEQPRTHWSYFSTRAISWHRLNTARKQSGSELLFTSGEELPDLPADVVKHIREFIEDKKPLKLTYY